MLFLNKSICSCITYVSVLKLHRIFVKIANEIGITSTLQKKSVRTKLNIFSVLLTQNQCRFYTGVEFIIYSLNNSSFAHKFFKICGKMLTFFEDKFLLIQQIKRCPLWRKYVQKQNNFFVVFRCKSCQDWKCSHHKMTDYFCNFC